MTAVPWGWASRRWAAQVAAPAGVASPGSTSRTVAPAGSVPLVSIQVTFLPCRAAGLAAEGAAGGGGAGLAAGDGGGGDRVIHLVGPGRAGVRGEVPARGVVGRGLDRSGRCRA